MLMLPRGLYYLISICFCLYDVFHFENKHSLFFFNERLSGILSHLAFTETLSSHKYCISI